MGVACILTPIPYNQGTCPGVRCCTTQAPPPPPCPLSPVAPPLLRVWRGPLVTCSSRPEQIEIREGLCQYTDMGSTNGSVYNRADVAANVPIVLRSGDVLKVGGTSLEVLIVPV
jgi:hypothetical protein